MLYLPKQQKNEALIPPPSTHKVPGHDGYAILATNIPLFNEINALPLAVDPARLDEGGGIEATLRRNGAKYHTNCCLAFNNTKLDRAKKRHSCGGKTDGGHAKQRTSLDGQTCIMCEKTSPESDLRQVLTMTLDKRLHDCAQTLNDGVLLAQLGGRDAIAQELKYHRACLTALYNRQRSHLRSLEKVSHQTKDEPDAYPLFLSELVNYMIETSLQSDEPTVFPLVDISQLYQ